MSDSQLTDNSHGNIHIEKVGRDLTVHGDIVAGNKTVIQNIIQKEIVKAPYKFLASYDISDRDIFFGRSSVIDELSRKIPRHKTMIINGQSGSGKTSLVNAGLIPRLADNGYFYITFRDYKDPVRELCEYLIKYQSLNLDKTCLFSLLDILRAIIRQKKTRIVVVLDQFERFFINVKPEHRVQFIQEVKICMTSDLSAEEMNFIFSVREDFFGRMMSEFESVIKEFFSESCRFNLHPLNKDEAREAIFKPLKNVSGVAYHLEFLEKVLLPGLMGEAAGGDQIEPPHLQIVCNQLFETVQTQYGKYLEEGGVIQIDHKLYNELGQAHGILRNYLDDCVEQIVGKKTENRDIVRSMLKLMIETPGTRKFISLANLQEGLPDIAGTDLERFIQKLQDTRVVETRTLEQQAIYSLSHEVMVEKVQSWYDEREMKRKQAQDTLERGLAESKNTGALLNERQVNNIRKWLSKEQINEEAGQLLTESEEAYEAQKQKEARQERRLKRRTRIIWSVIGIALIVSCILTIWALINREEAIQQAELANNEQKISRSRELAAHSRLELDRDPVLSFRLAEEALKVKPTLIARQAILPPLKYPFYNILKESSEFINSAFSPDGTLIATASPGGTVRIWDITTGEQLNHLKGHTEAVMSISFSSDRKFIVTASLDKTARIFKLATNKEYSKLDHDDKVNYAEFSPDGKYVVTASWDKTARIWDMDTGNCHKLEGHTGEIKVAIFSPKGKFIVTGDKALRIWKTNTRKLLKTLKEHTATVSHAEFSQDGRYIISIDYDENKPIARVWNVSGKLLNEFKGHNRGINSVTISRSGEYIATASKDKTARIWNVNTGQQVHVLREHTDSISSAVFSPDGKYILTASKDKTARIWDIDTGRQVHVLRGHTEPVINAAFSSDGKHVASISEKTVRIWKTDIGQHINILDKHTDIIQDLSISKNGKWIISASDDGTARIWDIATGQEYRELKGHEEAPINRASFSPNKKHVATASSDKTVTIWDFHTDQQVHVLEGHEDPVSLVAFSMDGKRVVSSDGVTTRIWDISAGSELRVLNEPATSAAFLNDGKQIITASDVNVRIWDVASGNQIRILKGYKLPILKAVVSPDGRHVTASGDRSTHIWETGTGKLVHTLSKHKDDVISIAFSPDGKQVVTASWDEKAYIWDISTGETIHVLDKHTDILKSAEFSPDGRRIITASNDKTARIWDAKTGEEIHALEGHKKAVMFAKFSPDGKRIITASKDNTIRIWPSNYHEVLKLINETKIRGDIRNLSKTERETYGFEKVVNNEELNVFEKIRYLWAFVFERIFKIFKINQDRA